MASAAYDNLAAKAAGNAIDLITKIYGVDNWGFGYFHINGDGNLAVAPSKDRAHAIDLYGVVRELIRRKQSPPFLLRFPQILDERMAALHQAFAKAIDEFRYDGRHLAVYPAKVNQKSEVVTRLLESGYRYELRAGSGQQGGTGSRPRHAVGRRCSHRLQRTQRRPVSAYSHLGRETRKTNHHRRRGL